MADDATTPDALAVDADAPNPATVETTEASEQDPKGAEALGDAGKKALDAMKAERNEARKIAQARQDEIDRLKAAAEGRESEWKAEKAARDAADARFAERIRNAEVKAAAKGKVDPDLAMRLLDLNEFEVSEDGTVDSTAIDAAIDDLITKYPGLAVQDGRRFAGSPDAGARKEAGPRQLTRADMAGMTPEQITAAFDKGLFGDLLAGKN